ncbi:MAG TPA: iron-sulfur cluster assembly accessory protein [Candidatus Polarisedimenticolia bacterium]|nr:iron-sulfur cluster assembly accessory protein [Candidatus Polarisedimenticolia bacterium]
MIEITPRAVAQIKKMMLQQGQEGAALRVGVKPAGCSGLEYVMDFDRQTGPGDQVQTFDGLRVVVDQDSLAYLSGIQLDWGEGLLGTGFKFSNPNASKTCGCGKSFSV